MHWTEFVFLVLVVTLLVGVYAYGAGEQRKAVAAFRKIQALRAPVSDEQRSAEFEGIAPELVQRLLRLLADVTAYSLDLQGVDVDPRRVLSTDMLWKDLCFEMDSLSYLELQIRLKKEFGVKIKGDFKTEPTVKEFIEWAAQKINQPPDQAK